MRIKLNMFAVVNYLMVFLLLLSIFVVNALSWSSVDTGQAFATHQFFNRHAYEELQKHPAFTKVHFPTLEKIQLYSGINIAQEGFGPDGKKNTNFTEHYFNPLTRDGKAPESILNLHRDLTEKMGAYTEAPTLYSNETARMAAYAAHFLQDLTCPMHVSGMEASRLDKNRPGLARDNSPYSPDYNGPEWKILVERFNIYKAGDTTIDFFDPLYYDGFLSSPFAGSYDVGSIKTGTHFQYELQVETEYQRTRPYSVTSFNNYRSAGYIPKNYSNKKSVEQLAMAAAELTRQRIGTIRNHGPLWYEKNDYVTIGTELFNANISVPYEDWWRAVQLTYVLWRSSICALYIEKEHIRLEGLPEQPDLFQLSVKVSNLEPIKGVVHDINIAFETAGGVYARGSLQYPMGLPDNKETGWLKFRQPVLIENPDQLSGEIVFTVSGDYPHYIPDSGKRKIGFDLSSVNIVIPEKKEEKKDAVSNTDNDNEIDQVPDEPKIKDDGKPTVVDKDDYAIKAIAIETENVIKDKKTYSKVDNIEAAVVIIRMRGADHIVDGYNALNILIEKGYVYSVQGVGLVTSEKFTDFMVEGIDKSLLNQSGEEDNRPAFVKKTKPDNDSAYDKPSDSKATASDSRAQSSPPSRDWRNLSDNEFVTALYDSILDRSPDKSGFNHWLQLLKSGKSRESCLSWFFKSPEYTSRKKTDSEFIVDVYQATYGRNPTQEELQKTLEELKKGISRQQIVENRIHAPQSIKLSKNAEKEGHMDAKKATKPCEGVIGKWSWFNGNTVTFSANGTMGGDPKYTWSCDGTNPDRVTINWNNKWIDKLTLSKDGSRLKGKNQHGTIVWGIKM